MLTDYELFLGGCYNAVVEINYDNDDIYKFMDLMEKLGFKKYVDDLKQIDERSGLIANAKFNNIQHLCIEYQQGKGFTWGDKDDYLAHCEETKVLSLEDLIKSVDKKEDYFLDYKVISLKSIGADSKLEILDDFCDIYGWSPVLCKKGFNIKDTQFENVFVEDECFETFDELVNRIVGRAIDYFRDEQEWEDDNDALEYGLELYEIGKKYKSGTKWEENWLETFKKELENF